MAFIAHISLKKFPADAGTLLFKDFLPVRQMNTGTAGIHLASEAAAA